MRIIFHVAFLWPHSPPAYLPCTSHLNPLTTTNFFSIFCKLSFQECYIKLFYNDSYVYVIFSVILLIWWITLIDCLVRNNPSVLGVNPT